MKPQRLHQVLGALSVRHPIFHSEADFQHELAMELHRHDYAVRLEVPIQVNLRNQPVGIQLDLLAINKESGRKTAIELKYITVALEHHIQGETFCLSDNWGTNLSLFDALADLLRVAAVVKEGKADQGFSVFITNAETAWSRNVLNVPIMGREFSIHEGRQLEAGRRLDWSPTTPSVGSVSKKRLAPYAPVEIPSSQTCRWSDYSRLTGVGVKFRYLLLSA